MPGRRQENGPPVEVPEVGDAVVIESTESPGDADVVGEAGIVVAYDAGDQRFEVALDSGRQVVPIDWHRP